MSNLWHLRATLKRLKDTSKRLIVGPIDRQLERPSDGETDGRTEKERERETREVGEREWGRVIGRERHRDIQERKQIQRQTVRGRDKQVG